MTPKQLLHQHYGLKATTQALPGEADINFRVTLPDASIAYTLKISQPNQALDVLELEAAAMAHLHESGFPYQIPAPVPGTDGQLLYQITDTDGQSRWLRLQTWVSGQMLGDLHYRSPELLAQWGEIAGHLTKSLQGFDHPAAHRFYKWDPSQTLHSRQYQTYILDATQLEITNYFWKRFETKTQPQLQNLRKSVSYNDAHQHNILINGNSQHPEITGLIDFGDTLYTHTINELAIACAYACMDQPDPLHAASAVIGAYHQIFPLEEQEIEALFSMIAARLLITVTSAAYNKHHDPNNEYLVISERPAWDLLKKWRAISPAFAHYSFRAACGWLACLEGAVFTQWLNTKPNTFTSPVNFRGHRPALLDLNVGSLDLGNNANFDTPKAFEKTINQMLKDQHTSIGIGGYAEMRPVYTTDAYEIMANDGPQWRTVHLGIDVWSAGGTPVLAPLAGTVHSFANNAADCDYGPTIILEHQVTPELTFYTLYGHLSEASLTGLQVAMPFTVGQQIATIGTAPTNGNWPPHLHFQVMLDMLGKIGDFPGVAFPHEQSIWLSICPNPAVFFPNYSINPEPKPSTTSIQQARKQHLGSNLSLSYQAPLHIVRGYRQYLYDTNARRYLDTVNNVAHVGHEHPKVVRAAQRQIGLLNTNTRYLHPNITNYAAQLLATFPPELSVVYFVNSGSEANELALRMAKAYTAQKDMLAIAVGYHGNTGGCIDVSSYKFDGKGGQGAPSHTHILPMPDTYRGIYRDGTGEKYTEQAIEMIQGISKSGQGIAGFIAESILSCGGQIMLPEGYLSAIYKAVRAAGGLCIADEVQVGFGRVGSRFWAFELQNVVPDIVTLGKPIGNGHPLAAVVTTPEVAAAFSNGMEYFNTFGGNPVSCAIGQAVLDVIEDEQLQENAKIVGNYLKQKIQDLQQQFPIIGDVRGIGLFLGFELVEGTESRKPAPEKATYLANRMRQRGVLMSTDGPDHNVIKIKPPMCFSKANADFLIEQLTEVFSENFMKE